MLHKFRRIGLGTTVLLFVLELGIVRGQGDDVSARLAKAFGAIDRAVASSTIPGMVIGITDRTHTLKVIAHGFADLKTKTPVTPETLFEIGSISKSFTAIALMQLFDEGRFDPQMPIAKYLPWFEVRSKYAPITGHHVLTHTAGLPNYRPDLASMEYATYALRDVELTYAPGEHYWYSNTGFQTLGYALERIDGAAYPAIIERRLLRRVGMASTVAVIDDALRAKLSVSYRLWPHDNQYVEQPWFEYRAADGSIASTAADMAAYARLLLNRGMTPTGRVVSERAFGILTTPALSNYAYGLRVRQVDGDTVITHGGGIAGFSSWLEVHLNDGFGVFISGNAGSNAGLRAWIVNALRAAIRNQPLPEPPRPPSAAEVAATAAGYAGVYRAPEGKTVEFLATSTGLSLKRGAIALPLTPNGPDRFRGTASDLTAFPFVFERANGKVVEVSHGSDWYTNDAYSGPKEFKTPPGYGAYVGRYQNHNPEGGVVRVFVRKGQLIIGDVPAVQMDSAEFRPNAPDYNPERYRFDTIIEGRAFRLLASGMPMYRVEGR